MTSHLEGRKFTKEYKSVSRTQDNGEKNPRRPVSGMVVNLGSIGKTFDQLTSITNSLDENNILDAKSQICSLIDSIADAFSEEQTKRTAKDSLIAAMELKCRSLTDKIVEMEQKLKTVESVPIAVEAPLPMPISFDQNEKNELMRLLERKNSEIQSLSEEVSRVVEKNKTLWQTCKKSEEELTEEKGKFSLAQIQQTALQNDLSRTEVTLKEREEELSALQLSYNEYRKIKTSYIVELEGKVDSLHEQNENISNHLAVCKEKNSELEKSNLSLSEKTHSLSLSLMEQEESFKSELASQVRIAALFKKTNEDLSSKLAHLEDIQQKSENLMEEHENQYKLKLEELRIENEKLTQKIVSRDDELQQIKKYIETDFINSISPTAGIVEKVKKSGKSFSEIYTDYLKLQQDFLMEKHEKENLKECLDEVMKDIEKNAPVMQKSKDDLEKSKSEMAVLIVELNECKETIESLTNENSSLSLRVKGFERESKFQEDQIEDLSRQVQVLLMEVEGKSKNELQSDSFSEKVIDLHNVADLQQKNQNLLKVVRELSQQLDELKQQQQCKQSSSELSEQLQHKLEETLKEVESLRESRKKQTQIVNEYLQKPISNEVSIVHDHFMRIKEEYESYKSENSQTLSQLNHQIDSLRRENSTFRIESFKISSQNEMLNEKNKSLKEELNKCQKDISKLQDRNDSLGGNLLEAQRKLQQCLDDLLQSKNEIHAAKSKGSMLQVELNLLKNNMAKITNENSLLIVEKTRLGSLLSNLQILQSNMDSTDSENKFKLINQLESLGKELSTCRSKLTHELEYSKSLLHNFESEKSDYVRKIAELTESKNSFSKDLLLSKTKNEELSQQVSQLSTQLDSSEKRISMLLAKADSSPDVQSSETSVDANENRRLKSTIARMHEELKLANSHVEEFKILSLSNEKALSETTHFANELVRKLENFDTAKQSELESIRKELENTSQKIFQLENEIVTLQEGKLAAIRECEENREKVAKFDLLQEQLDEKENYYQQHSTELNQQIKLQQEKYENEIMLHANDLKQMTQLKEQISSISAEFSNSKLLINQLTSEKEALSHELSAVKNSYESTMQELEFKVTEMARQNDILLSQLEALSNNIPKDNLPSNIGGEFEEVIRFLRREKEILTCQNDVLTKENRRLASKITQLGDEITSLNTTIQHEKASRELDDALKKEYKILCEKVEHANILRESNITLRAECENFKQKYADLQQQFSSMNEKFSPLENEKILLQSQIEALQQQLQTVSQDNLNWKERLEQVISRTETVDKSKFDEIVNSNTSLQQQLQEYMAKSQESTDKYAELSEKYVALENRSKRLAQLCQQLKTKVSQQPSADDSKLQELNKEIDELKERTISIQQEKEKLEEKNKKLTLLVQKTSELKETFEKKLQSEVAQKQSEWEKKAEDMKAEQELRISLLNSQWKSKFEKATANVMQEGAESRNASPLSGSKRHTDMDSGIESKKKKATEEESEPKTVEEYIESDENQLTHSESDIYEEGMSEGEDEEVSSEGEELEVSHEESTHFVKSEDESKQIETKDFVHPDEKEEELESETHPYVKQKLAAKQIFIDEKEEEEEEENEEEEEEEEKIEKKKDDEIKRTISLSAPSSHRIIRTGIQRIPSSTVTVPATSPTVTGVSSAIDKPLKSSTGRQPSISSSKPTGSSARGGRGARRGSKRSQHHQ